MHAYHQTVIRGTNLERKVYKFCYMGTQHALILDEYSEESRPSQRHRWQPTGRRYARLSVANWAREEKFRDSAGIFIPNDVREEAIRLFTESLEVGFWKN